MLMDPGATQHLMLTREENHPKSAILKRIMTPREGSNLIIAEGADWQRQRKCMAASFTHRAIENIAEVGTQAAQAVTTRLAAHDGEMVDTTCDIALSGKDMIDRNA